MTIPTGVLTGANLATRLVRAKPLPCTDKPQPDVRWGGSIIPERDRRPRPEPVQKQPNTPRPVAAASHTAPAPPTDIPARGPLTPEAVQKSWAEAAERDAAWWRMNG